MGEIGKHEKYKRKIVKKKKNKMKIEGEKGREK